MSGFFITIFVGSLLGSLHCVGMCGPFVSFYTASVKQQSWSLHLVYNLARCCTYMILGALAGTIGAAFDFAGDYAGVWKISGMIAGSMMIFWGFGHLLRLSLKNRFQFFPARVGQFAGRFIQRARNYPPVWKALFTGSLTTLLPCGWLYTFVSTAAATGSSYDGLRVMFVFWLGTLPMLLGLGQLFGFCSQWLRRAIPVTSAIMWVVLGVYGIVRRMPVEHTNKAAVMESCHEHMGK